MATVNDKIKNALNDYNIGLNTRLDAKFVNKADLATDTYVTKVAGKSLSTNDFTNDYRTKLDALSTETKTVDLSDYVKKDGAKVLSTNDFTDELKSKVEGIESTYAKKVDLASVLKYRGTIESFGDLPSDAKVGDVYNLKKAGGTDEDGNAIKAGDNVAKTETGWDVLAGAIDLSGYAQIHIGTTQPADTSAIWFDTSVD